MLEASNIDVFFNPNTPLQNHAIRGLSLEIGQGEFVTVIGSNGAGKSTLLGVFAGDVRPTSGRVRIDREDVTQEEPYRRARQIGRVFQDPRAGTCENMTILENLAVASARLREGSTQQHAQGCDWALARTPIGAPPRPRGAPPRQGRSSLRRSAAGTKPPYGLPCRTGRCFWMSIQPRSIRTRRRISCGSPTSSPRATA